MKYFNLVFTTLVLAAQLSAASTTLDYTINRAMLVHKYMSQVNEERIYRTIEKLSSYPNRYYLSRHGVRAAEELAHNWKENVKDRRDVEVKFFKHPDFPQPSIILKIHGSTKDQIIIGGHLDSINTSDLGLDAQAPGADDNASGIAVITEILKIISLNGYRPKNTLVFMAYAAEEAGLRGSLDIADTYYKQGIPVKGVLNLDGTNYNQSDIKIALVQDHTNKAQNGFLTKLIDRYIKVPWGYTRCDRVCSDHYSWDYRGYPASFPFEAPVEEENPTIHTDRDTLATSNNSAAHAGLFARLGLAYLIELDK